MRKRLILILMLVSGLMLCSISALADTTINVSPFDYEKLSVTISGNIGNSGIKTGSIYIVSDDTDFSTLSDTVLPVFADIVTTDSQGKFSLRVSFFEEGTAFTYGTYDVYLVSKDFAPEKKASFTYLSPSEIQAQKEADILNEVISSGTWQALKAAILGEDVEGNVINDNFAHINPDMTNYKLLEDKDELFVKMFEDKANINSFSKIKSEFERIALSLKNKPSGDNITGDTTPGTNTSPVGSPSYGPTSPVMSTTGTTTGSASGGGAATGGAAPQAIFTDMTDHWAQIYASSLAKRGIINGYEDGTFKPDRAVTRAELSKIIAGAFNVSAASSASFTDVSPDDWFAPYVNAMAQAGVVNGYDGRFNPDTEVTRQDAALMLYRAISLTHKLGIGYVFFADETNIASYAAEGVSALAEIGIITGNDKNEFSPLHSLTRGEAAALISRAADYISAH